MTDYTSVDAKFDRAVEHLECFEREVDIWLKTNPLVMIPKPKPDGPGEEDLYFHVKNPIPPRLPVLLGDCIHNFRCALDHLVMALALANRAGLGVRTVAFPICSEFRTYHGYEEGKPPSQPKRWHGACKVRTLRPPAQAFIEGLQPYHRRGNSWSLVELQELDNRDKHKVILALNPEAVATFVPAPGTTVTYIDPLRLKDGARFATITFGPNYSGVKMYPPVPIGIGMEHSNGVGWLDAIGFPKGVLMPHIGGIIAEAKSLFP